MKRKIQNSCNKKAFTLAEVLITLGIIGVVAALTIPALINNQQKQATVSQVKEIYSILSQATNQINSDCGGDISTCLTNPNAAAGNTAENAEVAGIYEQKLSVVKDCATNSSGCFPSGGYKYLNTVDDWYNPETNTVFYKIVIKNGMSIAFAWEGPTNVRYFNIYVDINGTKGPNVVGKDLFWFIYDRDLKVLEPMSGNYGFGCIPNTPTNGEACAGRILQEGAVNYY